MKEHTLFEFGRFRFYPDERRLFRDGKELKVTGKPVDILASIVRRGDSLVRNDQIINEVWPKTIVEPGNLTVQISHLRKAMGEDVIENVAGQGYRLKVTVKEIQGELPRPVAPRQRLNSSLAFSALVAVCGAAVLVGLFLGVLRSKEKMPAELATTAAADLYQRALDYERKGDDEQARSTLDEALKTDSAYCQGAIRAAYLSYELEEASRVDEYLKHCGADFRGIDEALRLKGQALRDMVNEDNVHALELLQLLRDRYPRDTEGLYRFAELATDFDRLDEADAALKDCLAVDPSDRYCWFELMYVRIKQNRFDDVLAVYTTLPASLREYPWFDEPVGVALFGKGELAKAAEVFESLSKTQQRFHGTAHFVVAKEWIGDLLLYQGHISAASRRIRQLAETSDNAASRGGYLAYLAQIYGLLGDTRLTREFAMGATRTSVDAGSITLAAIAIASIGDAENTEKVLRARSKVTSAPLSPANEHLIRGLLASAKNEKDSAIEELRLAHELRPRDELATYWLGVAYAKFSECESALPIFQRVIDLRGTVLLDDAPILLPLANYRAGQCAERLQKREAANRYYDSLTKVWADADPPLRALVQAATMKRR